MPKLMEDREEMVTMQIRLPAQLRAKLDRMASGTGVSRGELIRYLIMGAPEPTLQNVVTSEKPRE